MDWAERLFLEKKLLDVYLKARRVSTSKFNRVAAVSVFLACVSVIIVDFIQGGPWVDRDSLIITVRSLCKTGFTFSAGILGFLIAGFSIFASITRPRVFIVLAKIDYKKENISQLQFIFFNFLFVFIHFIAYLATSMFVEIFLLSKGLFSGILSSMAVGAPIAFKCAAGLLTATLIAWTLFVILLLKSFVWNLYQSVLLAIAAEAHLADP